MHCCQCGNLLPENARFCNACGSAAIAVGKQNIAVLRISGSPIEVYVETNSESAMRLCKRLHEQHKLPYEIVESPEQAERRWKPGMSCFYVKGNEWDILNLKESITMHLLMDGWRMQPATSFFIRAE